MCVHLLKHVPLYEARFPILFKTCVLKSIDVDICIKGLLVIFMLLYLEKKYSKKVDEVLIIWREED